MMTENKQTPVDDSVSALAPPDQRFDRRDKTRVFSAEDAFGACRHLISEDSNPSIRSLDGGYSNANFLVQVGARRWVVRFYPDGESAARREVKILEMAHAHGVRVPKVVGPVRTDKGNVSAILEFVDGPLIVHELRHFREIGRQLGLIHGIKFQSSGLIGPSGDVEVAFDSFAATAHQFIVSPLEGRAGQRLGSELVCKLRSYVDSYWHVVDETFSVPVLIHSDFNPKNLIAGPGPGQITVLDWEFSMVGHPLNDLGNFLRFSEDYSPEMRQEFLDGYQEVRGPLPKNWETASKLLDLVSMCSFLDREEELPRTFRTARYVIEKTLKRASTNGR